MIDRTDAHRLLDRLMDAMEQEQHANSDEARASAQATALAAETVLLGVVGAIDLRRRRLMVEALALPSGAQVNVAEFELFARNCLDGTSEGQIRLRQALARHATDSTPVLTKAWAGVQSAQLLEHAEARHGPLDGPVPASGVDPLTGAADMIRKKIVVDTGYTVGVEIGAEDRIPHTVWERAKRLQNALAKKARIASYEAPDLNAATIKDWCQKDGPLAAWFRDARGEGAVAGASPDPGRMLPI